MTTRDGKGVYAEGIRLSNYNKSGELGRAPQASEKQVGATGESRAGKGTSGAAACSRPERSPGQTLFYPAGEALRRPR